MHDEYGIYYIHLPDDSRLPRRCRTLTIAPRSRPLFLSRQLFEPESIVLEASDGRQIWSRLIFRHQHLLFLKAVTAEACDVVTYMVQGSKWNPAALWLRRASRLLSASAGLVAASHRLDLQFYEHFSKCANRAIKVYDQKSSNEHRLMDASIRQMEAAMYENQSRCQTATCDLAEARHGFDNARSSLQREEGFYKTGLAHAKLVSGQEYDRMVGVLRTPMMFIEDYSFVLSCTITAAQESLREANTSYTVPALVEQSGRLMNAIVGELLDPPTYRPEA